MSKIKCVCSFDYSQLYFGKLVISILQDFQESCRFIFNKQQDIYSFKNFQILEEECLVSLYLQRNFKKLEYSM